MKRLNAKLCGASLVALIFSLNMATPVQAQTCTAAPSCETLGFTKSASDCEGKATLKCPLDINKYFCFGDGESSGDRGCNIGDILYSDKTCSFEPIDGKTPIAVVFDEERRLAVALEEMSRSWSSNVWFNISRYPNLSEEGALADFGGKHNTEWVWGACNEQGEICPAFEYVSSYKTEGTNAGDWYLPALGELHLVYENAAILNETLAVVSGTKLNNRYWSSSISNTYAWQQFIPSGSVMKNVRDSGAMVRPVLAF